MLPFKFQFLDQTLWLSPERCIFWEEQGLLIVSDLHLGKTGHFRKSGIGVPQTLLKEDLQRLVAAIQYFRPVRLVVVGDMFHSIANKELELFRRWRNNFPDLPIVLIKGNHDILADLWYKDVGIEVVATSFLQPPFCFVHDIADSCLPGSETNYVISGHIHPAVALKGVGRQEIRLPCFYFGSDFAVLPAFGKFTGTATVEQKGGDKVFAIVPGNPMKKEPGVVLEV